MLTEWKFFWSDVCAFQFGLGVIVSPAKPNLACHEASRAVEFVVHATMFQKTNFGPTRDWKSHSISKGRMMKSYINIVRKISEGIFMLSCLINNAKYTTQIDCANQK